MVSHFLKGLVLLMEDIKPMEFRNPKLVQDFVAIAFRGE